jgi:hypothetical protein
VLLSAQALAPHENLIEILVSEATLSPAAELAPDASTFVAWDFFLHDSQATPVLPGSTPSFNTTVRYIVEADSFLLEYLSKQHLALEVFEARGWDVRALGVAHMPLKTLLQDLEVSTGAHWLCVIGIRRLVSVLRLWFVPVCVLTHAHLKSSEGKQLISASSAFQPSSHSCHAPALWSLFAAAALGSRQAWHHVDIMGSNGQQLGRVRVGFRVAKPIDTLLLQQHQQQQEEAGEEDQQQGHSSQLTGPDAVAVALQQAAEQVSTDNKKLGFRWMPI